METIGDYHLEYHMLQEKEVVKAIHSQNIALQMLLDLNQLMIVYYDYHH